MKVQDSRSFDHEMNHVTLYGLENIMIVSNNIKSLEAYFISKQVRVIMVLTPTNICCVINDLSEWNGRPINFLITG